MMLPELPSKSEFLKKLKLANKSDSNEKKQTITEMSRTLDVAHLLRQKPQEEYSETVYKVRRPKPLRRKIKPLKKTEANYSDLMGMVTANQKLFKQVF